MPTLKEIAREMYVRAPGLIGRTESIASGTATTMVVNALKVGTQSQQVHKDKWLTRRDTSTAADRVRICSNFTSSSGTLEHAGTSYSDTTFTSESVEITEFEPIFIDNAINTQLGRLKRRDREVIPTRTGMSRYFIHDLTWISEPSDIIGVTHIDNRVQSRNRLFEKWNDYSSGSLVADNWTLAGASATYARSTTQVRKGKYSAAITRAGTDCTLTQTVDLRETGVAADGIKGRTVVGVGVIWSAVASQVRVQVSDGVTTSNSSYHTGGSSWEELTVSHTMSTSATTLTVAVSVETSNTVAYADECYVVLDGLDDLHRRDSFIEGPLFTPQFDQGAGALALILPEVSTGGQYVVYSRRSYPQFDSTRIVAGTADADTTDAPLVHVAVGAIGRLFEALAGTEHPDWERFERLAGRWNARFEQLALGHTGQDSSEGDGVRFQKGPLAPPAVRRL